MQYIVPPEFREYLTQQYRYPEDEPSEGVTPVFGPRSGDVFREAHARYEPAPSNWRSAPGFAVSVLKHAWARLQNQPLAGFRWVWSVSGVMFAAGVIVGNVF